MKEYWALDPSVTYLNHGTVGAPPRRVLEVQQKLRDEIAILKGQKTRPQIAPSRLETPPRKPLRAGDKRPGSEKRSKKSTLLVHEEVTVPFPNRPPGAVSKGYEEYFVQDLVFHGKVTRYLRERIVTSQGHQRAIGRKGDRPDRPEPLDSVDGFAGV